MSMVTRISGVMLLLVRAVAALTWGLLATASASAFGLRIASVPDVITTLSETAEPLSVGQLQVGMKVHILHVPKTIIPLSASVLDPSVYPVCERAMGIELARYALEGTDADR